MAISALCIFKSYSFVYFEGASCFEFKEYPGEAVIKSISTSGIS